MQISGLDTNVNFLIDLASHTSFQAGDVHTGFIDQHFESLFPILETSNRTIAQAVMALITNEANAERQNYQKTGRKLNGDPFAVCDSFRLNHTAVRELKLESNEKG